MKLHGDGVLLECFIEQRIPISGRCQASDEQTQFKNDPHAWIPKKDQGIIIWQALHVQESRYHYLDYERAWLFLLFVFVFAKP